MTDNLISAEHVVKLGHQLQEIRERALANIISKLDRGYVFDNDLARSKEILEKLFDWFLLEPCTKQDVVFSLIKRILKSETGQNLVNHCGTAKFKKKLKQIRSYIEPRFYKNLDELLEILDDYQVNFIVPPLETDVPLSYRSNQSNPINVESTATTIKGYIHEDASAIPRSGPDISKTREKTTSDTNTLSWQSLIEADRHVLQSIESSLKRPPEPSALLHSSDFFSTVLLHDFPAEVFLQRPNIVQVFLDFLTNNCPSTRLINSILNGLYNLSKALQIRINHNNDPSMYNMMGNVDFTASSRISSPDSVIKKAASDSNATEPIEDTNLLKTQQMSFPEFFCGCIKGIVKYLCAKPDSPRLRFNQTGINLALMLLDELLNLMVLIFNDNNPVWDGGSEIETVQKFNEILINYGVVLEHFRLEANCHESNLSYRVTQLCLLHNCASFLSKMIPLGQTGLILPSNLKNALTNSLVDVTLAKLYPNVHETLLKFAESFSVGSESESLMKYHETNKVCTSMNAAIEFMSKSYNAHEGVQMAIKAVPSLEFHKDLRFVKYVMDLCTRKLPLYASDADLLQKSEVLILKLLSHNLDQVKEETYKLCHNRVISAIGTRLNSGAPGEQILFLLCPAILVEIAAHGLTSDDLQIQTYSEDILIHLLKCKILVSETIWNKIVEALITAFPILLCHASKGTSLGRNLLEIIDPDVAETLLIPPVEVVKTNVALLFGREALVREEAFSRLCWLLSNQTDSREMLPRLNNLYDKALPHLCQNPRLFDVNKNRFNQHFYQPSSLRQVLDMLKSQNIEPVIRRSALTQTCVITEDPLLHSTFLECGGIEIVLDIMRTALIEKNFTDYPDSVIPAVGILKNLCLFNATARQFLSCNIDVYYNILRSLFMFFTEERLKQDGVCVLFLLVFNDFIHGSPAKADFSIPHLVSLKLNAPFHCNTHWKISPHFEESRLELLVEDRWCLNSIQIQWNSELFGGFDKLLSLDRLDYSETDVADVLKLNIYDLKCLKASSVEYCIGNYLKNIQNGTTHEVIIDSINKLATYLHLAKIATFDETRMLSQPWESTFARFLKILPSSSEDGKLLIQVLKFLKLLVPFYKSTGPFWLSQLLKSSTLPILDLIGLEATADDEFKTLSHDLLTLITTCASSEQHFLDFSPNIEAPKSESRVSWGNIIEIIASNLNFNDTTHFYNLAHLNSLLSCLVHLTAILGWSIQKPKNLPSQLVSSLCELIVVFHCGKGQIATLSLMGLSITRHVILILNHIIAELHYTKMKQWEVCFMEVETDGWVKSFLLLWSSRDVVLRAAALQFFAGLTTSPQLAIYVINELKNEHQGIWYLTLTMLLDSDEASIVRENCAVLLGNLTKHIALDSAKSSGVSLIISHSAKHGKDDVGKLLDLLDEFRFYKSLIAILNCLYTNQLITCDLRRNIAIRSVEDSSSDSAESDKSTSISTPALVKNLAFFLLNLLSLSEDKVSYKMQDYGLIKLFFRCICNPTMSIDDTKKLSLYCEIVEMNSAICQLLGQMARINAICLGTILHTKDCLSVLLSLLNPQSYHIQLSQLIYLRNRLWSEVFKLLAILIRSTPDANCSEEALTILSDTIAGSGKTAFVEVLCESIRSIGFNDLQMSALLALTSLLGVESQKTFHGPQTNSSSMQNLLDTVRTSCHEDPKSNLSERIDDNAVLRSVFFDDESTTSSRCGVVGSSRMAGAELCKILLNLYDLGNLKVSKDVLKLKSLIVASLTSIVCVSFEAKNYAFRRGLLDVIIKQLKDFYVKLSLESVDCLRRVLDKKRVCPILDELNELIGLITNLMVNHGGIKLKFAQLGLSDLIHKLWVWFVVQKIHLTDLLKMLCTFTTDCSGACQSFPLTSSVAGSGPRKIPTKLSLLHAIINLIEKEMDQVSRTHSLNILELSFRILNNCCSIVECRMILCKSNLLQNISRLHPAITKKQKPWESVELIWLEFLGVFSLYPEGQSSIAKNNDVFELILTLVQGAKSVNASMALVVLRNVAFHQPNRVRLLTSSDFLRILQEKLENGTSDEKNTVVLIMWTLAANNQKAKIVFKAAQLDVKLQLVLKHCELTKENFSSEDINRMRYVLNVVRDAERLR